MQMRSIVGVLVGVLAFFGVRALLDGPPTLPDTIAGAPRMTDAIARGFEEQMATEADRYGIEMAAGLYGSSAPEFFVLVVDEAASETTDELFDSFVAGMSQGGASVDASRTETGALGAAEYRCVPVTAPGVDAGACMWRSETDVGIVFRLQGGLSQAHTLLVEVHRAVGS